MTIPLKYEDVVAKLGAALGREADLRESLTDKREEYNKLGDRYDALQQRLTVAERRESEAREELLDLSRKLDVFYSRSHGIKNLSAIEDANDKSKALQQRLTVAEHRAGEFELLSVKQAALLDELGIPLDEVDDLFGETLKNARRYEYLRSVMAIENFPDPHPEWSEPSEAESKRIDDLCDAALKPAAEPHKCIECESQYCHGVCVERGDDDERYKGAEGEGS